MKKLLSYFTPKKIQAEHKRPARSMPGKKKYACKKIKAAHMFALKESKIYKWFPRDQGMQTRMNEYRCLHCNKKQVEFIEEPIV
jgi:hypothetical protein